MNQSSTPPLPSQAAGTSTISKRSAVLFFSGLLLLIALATFVVIGILVTMFERKQEARNPFLRVVEVSELTTDPVPWGLNWPHQYDTYLQGVDPRQTDHGGSSALPASKLDQQPWLKRLYAGYAFSLDYREARGHAFMLQDQEQTRRVTERTQSGACLHCHASVIPTYRRLGMEELGQAVTLDSLAESFNWTAVMAGFRLTSQMDYTTAHAELLKTPDGTPSPPSGTPSNSTPNTTASQLPDDPENFAHQIGTAHPVSCVDCHDPDSMKIRVTRPGFLEGIAALAKSTDQLFHLPSLERWRQGNQSRVYDPNLDASRQEMRTFVCAQCHVEYYCGSKETLFFPWTNGLKVEQIEQTFDEHTFPDGTPFLDYLHGETGAPVYKAQHPEFELWSQGIHARSGVSCADCHMPYERKGAMKVSSHSVRSPLNNINRSCQTCHNVPEQELRYRIETIQQRTIELTERAAVAMTEMLDAIRSAQAAGLTPEQLQPLYELQKKAMWRLDFISSENSKGFHADQESARILAESIDYSRQAQALAHRLRAPDPIVNQKPVIPVSGITPSQESAP